MKEKKRFSIWRLLLIILLVLVLIAWFFPLYNQLGVHTADEFLQNTADGVFKSNKTVVLEQDGVLSFTDSSHEDLSPLTVTQNGEVYTILQEGEILFVGKAPDTEHDRIILADGTLIDTAGETDEIDMYPVSVSQAIAIVSENLETKGNSRYLLPALAIWAIWCIDILFPDFFFQADFRQMGKKNTPSPTYRKIQRVLRIILPWWGLMCLFLAVL